jgi:hypothetical protein
MSLLLDYRSIVTQDGYYLNIIRVNSIPVAINRNLRINQEAFYPVFELRLKTKLLITKSYFRYYHCSISTLPRNNSYIYLQYNRILGHVN